MSRCKHGELLEHRCFECEAEPFAFRQRPESSINVLKARIAALEAELLEWHDYFGCSSPHDVYLVNSSTDHMIAGKEQERANRLAAKNALLRKTLEDAPHADACSSVACILGDRSKGEEFYVPIDGPCDCWKAALARIPEAAK